MVRVMHLIDAGGLYGAERVIINLSREMRRWGELEPIVATIVPRPGDANQLLVAVQGLGLAGQEMIVRNHMLILDLPRLIHLVRRLKVDVIHSHGYKPSVFGYLVSASTGIKILATCHLWFARERMPLKQRAMLALERLVYRRFPIVVGVSDDIVSVLHRNGVAPQKTRLVRNGIVLEDFRPSTTGAIAHTRRSLGIQSGEFFVLNLGRLTEQKAQDDLIRATRILVDRGIPVRVCIAGTGELQTRLEETIADCDLAGRVSLLGFRADSAELLQAADLFVLPSVDEGMPMALLEAIAANTAVVATPVGDVPKLIEGGRTGVLVPPRDPEALATAMASLLSNEDLRTSMAARARAFVESEYSSEVMYREYAGLYSSLCGVSP